MNTGYPVRVERNGVYRTLDIAELTDDELVSFFEKQPADRLIRWCVALAKWARDKSVDPHGECCNCPVQGK